MEVNGRATETQRHYPLLINPPYTRRPGGAVVPPMGLALMAASLREEACEPQLLDLACALPDHTAQTSYDAVRALDNHLAEHGVPSLALVGPLVTANLSPARDLIGALRRAGCPSIVVGGPLTASPGFHQVFNDHLGADAYLWGEGDHVVKDFWNHRCDLAGLTGQPGVGTAEMAPTKPLRVAELDQLPLPARDLCVGDYHQSLRRTAPGTRSTVGFLSRGCPYACTFCAAPLVSGSRVRRHSGPRVTQELDQCDRLGFGDIVFYDDCLFVKGPRLDDTVRGFTRAFERSQWEGTFSLELRCDALLAMSDESLKGLVEVGLRQVNMGIEKATSAALERVRKKLAPDVAIGAVKRAQAFGLRTAGTFILGGPGEDIDDIVATIDFAANLPLTFAHFNPLALYPGTQAYQEVYGSGADWAAMCLDPNVAPWGDILYTASTTPLEAILEQVFAGYQTFYSERRLAERAAEAGASEISALEHSYTTMRDERSRLATT